MYHISNQRGLEKLDSVWGQNFELRPPFLAICHLKERLNCMHFNVQFWTFKLIIVAGSSNYDLTANTGISVMFAYWQVKALPLHRFCMAIKPVKIFFFQYQSMHSDAEFYGESDFAIKRGLNSRFDWVTEGQSWNLVLTGPSRVPGKERVNLLSRMRY